MNISRINRLLILSVLVIVFSSCADISNSKLKEESFLERNKEEFVQTLQKHLDAVSNRNLDSLKSTLSPEGKMQLILPGSEVMYSVDSFIAFHRDWFQDTTGWSFETKILNTEIGDPIGMAITEIIYREPERDGKPYFNRMIVSYDLERIGDRWYIIKDHASSVEKSTDRE